MYSNIQIRLLRELGTALDAFLEATQEKGTLRDVPEWDSSRDPCESEETLAAYTAHKKAKFENNLVNTRDKISGVINASDMSIQPD